MTQHAGYRPGAIGLGMGLVVLLVSGPAAVAEDKQPPSLLVGREDGKLMPLTAKDWDALPRTKVPVKDRDGKEVTYEGVSLAEVLRFAGVPFGEHLRGPRVANYVLVEAADGYRAALALAEIDPSTSDKIVVLADRRDGEQLAKEFGPFRLLVPGDKIHSRWVRQVIRIRVLQPPAVKDEAAPKK